jgi:hypothetical protein
VQANPKVISAYLGVEEDATDDQALAGSPVAEDTHA